MRVVNNQRRKQFNLLPSFRARSVVSFRNFINSHYGATLTEGTIHRTLFILSNDLSFDSLVFRRTSFTSLSKSASKKRIYIYINYENDVYFSRNNIYRPQHLSLGSGHSRWLFARKLIPEAHLSRALSCTNTRTKHDRAPLLLSPPELR